MASRLDLILQFTSQGLHGRAVDLLREALVEEPDSALLHVLMASNLIELRRFVAAEHEAKVALRIDPSDAGAHRVLGYALAHRQYYGEAVRAFEEAVRLDPDLAENHLGLGHAHWMQRDLVQAELCLRRALELDPRCDAAHSNLALVALQRNDLVNAESEIEMALSMDAEDAGHLAILGVVRYRQGRLAEARELSLSALRINPLENRGRTLLCWLKAKESLFLWLYWHWIGLILELPERGRIALLVGAYLGQKLVRYVLADLGLAGAASFVFWAWMVFSIYTWVAPTIFDALLERELETIRLDENF